MMALIFLTAVILLFIYPLCHEAGHLITASLIGAEILNLGLFPEAHVDLAMPDSSEIKIMLIALYYIICTHPLSRTVNYLKKTEKNQPFDRLALCRTYGSAKSGSLYSGYIFSSAIILQKRSICARFKAIDEWT